MRGQTYKVYALFSPYSPTHKSILVHSDIKYDMYVATWVIGLAGGVVGAKYLFLPLLRKNLERILNLDATSTYFWR